MNVHDEDDLLAFFLLSKPCFNVHIPPIALHSFHLESYQGISCIPVSLYCYDQISFSSPVEEVDREEISSNAIGGMT